ncbi:MAG: biotin/lipoyl-containing protein [Verrucomicrobiota bacterium]
MVDEGYAMCGLGAEIAAAVGEEAFDDLDAPVSRLTMDPVSHPLHPGLESECLPTVEKIAVAIRELMAGKAVLPKRPLVAGRSAPSSVAPVPAAAVAAPTPAPAPVVAPAPARSAPVNGNGAGEALILPHGDLTVSEATVVKWLKKPGEKFQKDEAIVDVETEKAVSSVEAPFAGRLSQILVPVGEKVKMGTTLGLIEKA